MNEADTKKAPGDRQARWASACRRRWTTRRRCGEARRSAQRQARRRGDRRRQHRRQAMDAATRRMRRRPRDRARSPSRATEQRGGGSRPAARLAAAAARPPGRVQRLQGCDRQAVAAATRCPQQARDALKQRVASQASARLGEPPGRGEGEPRDRLQGRRGRRRCSSARAGLRLANAAASDFDKLGLMARGSAGLFSCGDIRAKFRA